MHDSALGGLNGLREGWRRTSRISSLDRFSCLYCNGERSAIVETLVHFAIVLKQVGENWR